MTVRWTLLMASSVLVVACGRTELLPRFRRRGELTLVWDDDQALERRSRALDAVPGYAEFGDVVAGSWGVRIVRVENSGSGALRLERVERLEGDADEFEVSWAEATIAPGDSQPLAVTFRPSERPGVLSRPLQARFRIVAGNVEPNGDVVELHASGTAVSRECEVPSLVDFGAVEVGASEVRGFELVNRGARPTTAFTSDLRPAGDAFFRFAAPSSQGAIALEPSTTRPIDFVFSPTTQRSFEARLDVRRAAGCPSVEVRLIGEGVDRVLSWSPPQLDFGLVPPKQRREQLVTFTNKGLRPVSLRALGVVGDGAFSVTDASLDVPAARREAPDGPIVPSSRTLVVGFSPQRTGLHSGALTASSNDRRRAAVEVPLEGTGGGPDIEVTPHPRLDFGRLGWTGAAHATTRPAEVRNVGVGRSPMDLEAALRFTGPFGVRALRNATADELCVGVFDEARGCVGGPPSSFDAARGLLTGEVLSVPLRVQPRGPGSKAWAVTFSTNDPDAPAVTLEVVAEVLPVPVCDVAISPARLDFGALGTATRDLGFVVHNRSTTPGDVCLLSGVSLGLGSSDVFSLPVAVSATLLGPNESQFVPVRASRRTSVTTSGVVTGSAEIELANGPTPRVTVPLSATLGQPCLIVSPGELDFGTVRAGCGTVERSVLVVNACEGPVSLIDTTIDAVTSQGAAEFQVLGGVSGVASAGASVVLRLRYRPVDVSSDRGFLRVHAQRGGDAFDIVTVLRGRGAPTAENVDTFRQGVAKVDVLFVVDDSCSMSDKQRALGQNFGAFLQELRPRGVDFRLGVVTTDFVADAGTLRTSPSGRRFVENATAGLEHEFAALVDVGIDGSAVESCLAGSTAALESDFVTTSFLRDDAALAVICVTDAPDQAPSSNEAYWSRLTRANPAVTYSVVGPFLQNPPTGCIYDGSRDDGRHVDMVSRTSGVQGEICTANWGQTLARMGGAVAGVRRSFPLAAVPDSTQPITVNVDGAWVSPVDARGSRVWAFEPSRNAVEFTELFTPPYGASVSVHSQSACVP